VGMDTTCSVCKGSGVEIKVRKLSPGMVQQMQQECSQCGGSGIFIPKKDRCTTCDGKMIITQTKRLEVIIKPGMQAGERIYFRQEAHQAPGATPGDVVLVLAEIPHPIFIRKGSDLYMTQTINLTEALGGFAIPIETLDKRRLRISLDPKLTIIATGDVKLIKGEGMPMQSSPNQKGNLFVKFNVVSPKVPLLDENTVKTLETKLGQQRRLDASKVDKEVNLLDPSGASANFDFYAYRKEQEKKRTRPKIPKKKKGKRRRGTDNTMCTNVVNNIIKEQKKGKVFYKKGNWTGLIYSVIAA